MRPSLVLLSCLLLPSLAQAESVTAETTLPLLEHVGVKLLCEQSSPLLLRGQPDVLQSKLAVLFDSQTMCQELAEQVATALTVEQTQQAQELLQGEITQQFSAAERAVGEQPEKLGAYRERLREQAPRGERVGLIKRLDDAAHTTELASMLRYELGKTQALIALLRQGQNLDEAELTARTQTQHDAIRQSSADAVSTFMLFAYRQIPSEQLEAYVNVYEAPSIKQLLKSGVDTIPLLFADRRDQLRKDINQISAVQ